MPAVPSVDILARKILLKDLTSIELTRALADLAPPERLVRQLPAMLLTFIYVLWRSAIITRRQGGVRWRDTFYPLDELRSNQLR